MTVAGLDPRISPRAALAAAWCLWWFAPTGRPAPLPGSEQAPIRAEIVEARLVDVGLDSATADIVVEARSERRVRIRSFRFRHVAANGMPAYLDPVFEAVEIPAGARVRLPAFRATVRFRDLSTLDPVRALLEEARIRVEGAARVEIELDWFERLAVGSRRAVVWHGFNETLPLQIPGGRLRELSAKALFALAEPVAQAGWELRDKAVEWTDESWAAAAARTAEVRTSYRYRVQAGAPGRAETAAAGVLLTPQIVLAPLEAVEPWRFDPVLALALQRGEAQLLPRREVEVLLPPGEDGERERFRLSLAQLEVETRPCETERVLVADRQGKTRRVKVCRSGGRASLAVLRFVPKRPQRFTAWQRIRPEPRELLELTAMRLLRGRDDRPARWELLRLQGRADGDEIRLVEPVDPAALGSPLLLEGIPLGVIQHERGGSLLAGWELERVQP